MSTVLAIESAIAGGSVTVVIEDIVAAEWVGKGQVSAAEELLPAIDGVLSQAGIDAARLDTVAVSNGPGSFTGIRIGIATALGLSRALQIPCVGVSCLAAVADCQPYGSPRVVVLPFGKRDVVWQRFDGAVEVGAPFAESAEAFLQRAGGLDEEILAHADLEPLFVATRGQRFVTGFGRELSRYIAIAASSGSDLSDPAPIYVHRSDQTAPRVSA